VIQLKIELSRFFCIFFESPNFYTISADYDLEKINLFKYFMANRVIPRHLIIEEIIF